MNQLKFIRLFLSTGCRMAALRDISPLPTSGLELSSPPPLGLSATEGFGGKFKSGFGGRLRLADDAGGGSLVGVAAEAPSSLESKPESEAKFNR